MAKDRRGGQNGAKLGRTREQDQVIKKLVKQTQNLKNEQYRIINSNGDVVLAKKGSKHEVATTVGEKRENLDGNISLHNHPEGGTFSPDDMSDFGYGAREIVAATPEGTYRLINKKFGTKEAKNGWVQLRDGAEKIPEQSTAALLKQARENLANSSTYKEIKKINERWAAIREREGNEAAQAYYSTVRDKYDSLIARQRDEVRAEARRLETKPFDDYYRNNATRYGFIYRFEPIKKRK